MPRLFLAACAALALTVPTLGQSVDPVAGPHDQGKMWLFEEPPVEYLRETYGFEADQAWFDHARMATLRLPGCSGAFVSPYGLVLTNHHCIRGAQVGVTRDGEDLNATGFAARTVEEERPLPGFEVDQLISAEDVTAEVDALAASIGAEAAADSVAARLQAAAGADVVVEVEALYAGARHSAYTFRRYTDVRLVMTPEEAVAAFGGDADNFTYPRYALDAAFLRVYGPDAEPLRSEYHFAPNPAGVAPGDAVFVIGNPGSTQRLLTAPQLLATRDVENRGMLAFLDGRIEALRSFLADTPSPGLRIKMLGLLNAQKAYRGRQDALAEAAILARRADADRQLREALLADPALARRFGGLHDSLRVLAAERRALADEYGAFQGLLSSTYSSSSFRRAYLAAHLAAARQAGMEAEALAPLRQRVAEVADLQPGLDRAYLASQLTQLRMYLPDEPAVRAALQGAPPERAAARLLAASPLADSASAAEALDDLSMDDPLLRLAEALAPRYAAFVEAYNASVDREAPLLRRLGRARFAVYGAAEPPDATFSPRFTDGVVQGYPYNGTEAPPYTTLTGMYDHHYSYPAGSDWTLPQRWLEAEDRLELSTPLNFASTSDTIGGNSGSPVVDHGLGLVGVNFDRNVEGLSRDYVYSERGRNVVVDVHAILAALDHVYDLDRVAAELRTGRLFRTEAEADAVTP